jgi:TolB-like protein/DNA-binding winged helix-turn-helix (wHTH) protein/Tfp pilus assembly protein PilF
VCPALLKFADFEFDCSRYELRRAGHPVKLEKIPMELLQLLAESNGRLVSREEIEQRLWGKDVFVDAEHGINTAIRKIRQALGDDPDAPRFVQTVQRKGYRFIADVSSVPAVLANGSPEGARGPARESQRDAVSPIPPSAAIPGPGEKRTSRRRTVLAVAAAAALLAWPTYKLALSRTAYSTPGAPVIRSIAVLPLANLSGDSADEYFADGMTDELITNLAKVSSLRVISRTSVMRYRDPHKSVPEIARELGVDAVIEGTVLRTDGKVRITAQLINGMTDRHLWAEEYRRDARDVLTLQNEIARTIAGSINARLTAQEQSALSLQRPVDPDVEDLYWKGVYFLSKTTIPDFKHAETYFDQMVQAEPSSARAWTGIAMANHYRGMFGDPSALPRAKAAALKAVALDDSLAEAHAELAMLSFVYDWNIPKAEEEFQRAFALAPRNYSRTHVYYALMLAHIGRADEALAEIERARHLDPLSAFTAVAAGNVYYCARHYDDSIRVLKFALELDPAHAWAHHRLGMSWEFNGDYQKALEEFRLASEPDDAAALRGIHRLKQACESGGESGYWRESLAIALEGAKRGARERRGGSTEIARIYMHLGDREHAVAELERAYAVRDLDLNWWIRVHPEFDSIRSDPRVVILLRDLYGPATS